MAMGQAKEADKRMATGDDRTQWEKKKAAGYAACGHFIYTCEDR
jgi:hypothetical protein